MLKRIRQWWERRRAMKETNCAFWCPTCKEELHYHAQGTWEDTDQMVLITVCECGHVSRWFWGAPVPILLTGDSR